VGNSKWEVAGSGVVPDRAAAQAGGGNQRNGQELPRGKGRAEAEGEGGLPAVFGAQHKQAAQAAQRGRHQSGPDRVAFQRPGAPPNRPYSQKDLPPVCRKSSSP